MCRSRNGYTLASAGAAAIACALMLGVGAACAQEARIENVTVAPRDAKTATVKFDITWDNSWRDKTNHDAAWVFFKVRADDKSGWQHVRLVADKVLNPTGYGQAQGGTPLDFIVPDGDDGFTGMFVRRAAEGKGPLAARGVTAVWDSTANKGITKDLKGVSIRAFGIEIEPISVREAGEMWPLMRTDDLVGAIHIPRDGQTLPQETAEAPWPRVPPTGAAPYSRT